MPILSTIGAACARAYGFTSGLVKDQYFNLVSLLLPGNGTNGATNNSFLDSSSNAFTVTRNGNTTQGLFSPFSQTGWGAYFDGASDYIQYTNSDFSVSTGDFTAEWWMYVTSDRSQVGIMTAASNANLTIGYGGGSANARQVYVEWGGSGAFIGTMSNYANTWVHICVMRSSGTVYTFQNGTLLSSAAKSAALGSTANMVIGTNSGDIAAQSFPGYLSNVRFSKAAVYSTSGFTPITSPLTRTSQGATNVQFLTLQSNRLLDSNGVNTPAASPLTITRNGDVTVVAFSPFAPTAAYTTSVVGGSGYFDGTGDYLSLPTGSFVFGSSDFTIEAWVYNTGTTTGTFFNGQYTSGATTTSIIGAIGSLNGNFDMYIGGTPYSLTGINPALNQWVHLAIVRTGGTVSVFQNGTRTHTRSDLGTLSINTGGTTVAPQIGSSFLGYYSNNRIIIGSGPYDATQTSITVPTSPLTAVTNTQLLLNFTNAGIFDATAKNDLETVGNAQISTTQSKWGGSSIYLDGAGDYLSSPVNDLTNFGNGAFTVEGWVRINATGSFQAIYSRTLISTSGYGGTWVRVTDTNVLQAAFSSGTSAHDIIISGTTALTTGQWYHFAWVRSSNTFYLYLNGGQEATTTSSVTMYASGDRLSVGSLFVSGSAVNNLNGYVNDLRVTKGFARYTGSTYTVPSAPFPVQ